MRKLLLFAISGAMWACLASAAVDDPNVTPRTKALLLKAAAAPSASSAQKAPMVSPQLKLPELTAQQIVDRNIIARGGLAAWQQVQTMRMSGKLDAGKARRDGGHVGVADRSLVKAGARAELKKIAMGKADGDADADKVIQLPFVMEMKRPSKTRLEIQFLGQTAMQVYDGANGWKLRPYLGRHDVEPFTPDELKVAASQQQLDGPLINYATKGTRVELDGAEQVEGRNAYRLKLILKNGDVRRLWVDAENFLEVKMEGAPRRLDGRLHVVTTAFHDYRSVDGLKIPYALETRVDGYNDRERIVFDQVALNPPLEDMRFARPE